MEHEHVTGLEYQARVRRTNVIGVAAGLATLGAGMVVVRHGTVSAVEESAFSFVNSWPGWLYAVAWPLQQLGNLLLGPAVVVAALLFRKYRLAVAAVVATVLKLASERIVKTFVTRERPGTSIGPDIVTRGDVSRSGESFVSGHAVLVAALATVVTPYLPGRWKALPWVLVGAVMLGRVYVGAHNPLDVICGAALGIAIGCVVNLALPAADQGRRSAHEHATDARI
jgi:glycosyltransferase 2 family protein